MIAKAQKIIEKLTVKSDSDERVMKRLSDECDGYKREIGEKQRAIKDLSEQLKEVSAKNSHDHTLMQQTMSKELEEVRNAVQEYQTELGTEKSNYMQNVANLEQ